MPIYEYECTNKHQFELKQAFNSEPKASCPSCEAPARRVIKAVAVHYKGSGFYTTDYARANAPKEDSGAKSPKAEAKDGAKAPAKEPVSASPKSEPKSESKDES